MALNSRNFGLELEFCGLSLDTVNEKLSKYKIIPYQYLLMHKAYKPSYNEWYLDFDDTVSLKLPNGDFSGGELSSRIFQGNEEDWFEICNVVDFLSDMGSYTTGCCGLHFTFDISDIIKDQNFIKTLSRVLAVYETNMELFYMGSDYNFRALKDIYATSIGLKLREVIDYIDEVDLTSKKSLESFIRSKKIYTFQDGINLQKYGLMEIRYPNGTLDYDIIRNECEFSLSLIHSISNGRFDLDYLDYIISQDMNNQNEVFRREYPFDRFIELVNTIESNNDMKNRYIKQYEKVIRR